MTDYLRQYESRKQLVLDRLDGLLAGDDAAELIGCTTSNPSGVALLATIAARRRALDAGEFVVAVAGQMNAGKSSVLNALLFGRYVLPVSPVTMTAKVTRIVHGAPDRVRGIFYTPEEFEAVASAYTALSGRVTSTGRDNAKAWEALLDTAAQNGVYARDVVKGPAKVIDSDQLDAVKELVAVPKRGGKYSPFVNTVEIRTDLPWARSVVFVDTPGISDPNPVRERITHDWIARADAVLYISYAGQAGLTQTDREFVADHLAHVAPERRLLVVNKCDTVRDTGEIDRFLNDLKMRAHHDPAFEFLRASGDPLLVSASGALEARQAERSKSANDSSANADRWSTWEGSGFAKLTADVERIIVKESGDGVLRSAVEFMLGLTRKAHQRLDCELQRLDEEDRAQLLHESELPGLHLESIEARRDASETIAAGRDEATRQLDRAVVVWKKELWILAEQIVNDASVAADHTNPRIWRASIVTAFFNEFNRRQSDIDNTVDTLLAPALATAYQTVLTNLAEITSNKRLRSPVPRQLYESSVALRAQLADSMAALRPRLAAQFGRTWGRIFTDFFSFNGKDQKEATVVARCKREFVEVVTGAYQTVVDDIANQLMDSFKRETAAQAEIATAALEKRIEMLERQMLETSESRRQRNERSRERQVLLERQRQELEALAGTWRQLGMP